MEIGVTLRNMGDQSTSRTMLECARAAESAGFESIWITDHIAIPPDDAEGSGGRYLETLSTLAWLAGATTTIKIGSGVLILPYREKLMTAKQVATIQELSGDRLLLGVGIGWMDAEFKALGLDRHQRGHMSDDVLEFLSSAFSNEVVTSNEQEFLFKPRPVAPPVYVGGRAPHALRRAVKHQAGWIPMIKNPAQLSDDQQTFAQLCDAAGVERLPIAVMTNLRAGEDPGTAKQWLDEYQRLGVERVICAVTYQTSAEYQDALGQLAECADL